ncbi:MAG: hypothetical protein PHE17_19460 [Thiothrix sp.]|uniref:hypothetical protein n=1 Tax=Thiothrix sp. TaxID=1032 RepID=UPI00262E9B17|nr:hypothetical protein [Thiothrix sp.]MDD5395206.1 hypothetical protein [Thiothrix sp.]
MTKEESIKKSILIWSWLYENPKIKIGKDRFRISEKIHAYIALGLDGDDADCPLCEYVNSRNSTCDFCPAHGLWGTDNAMCQTDRDSPWNKWRLNGTEEKKKQSAGEMVELLGHALARLSEM